MVYNDKRILHVLRGELGKVPERCEGYRDDLAHLLGDVLLREQSHAIRRTDIVKRIADLVNRVGMDLYKSARKGG